MPAGAYELQQSNFVSQIIYGPSSNGTLATASGFGSQSRMIFSSVSASSLLLWQAWFKLPQQNTISISRRSMTSLQISPLNFRFVVFVLHFDEGRVKDGATDRCRYAFEEWKKGNMHVASEGLYGSSW